MWKKTEHNEFEFVNNKTLTVKAVERTFIQAQKEVSLIKCLREISIMMQYFTA